MLADRANHKRHTAFVRRTYRPQYNVLHWRKTTLRFHKAVHLRDLDNTCSSYQHKNGRLRMIQYIRRLALATMTGLDHGSCEGERSPDWTDSLGQPYRYSLYKVMPYKKRI